MGRALEYFRRVTKETDSVLARALASECGYICGAALILFTPRAPRVKRSAPPAVLPESMSAAPGIIRTLSRIAGEAARVEGSYLRVFDACYGYSIRYNLPMSKGRVSPKVLSGAKARSRRPAPLVAPFFCSTPRAAGEERRPPETGQVRRPPAGALRSTVPAPRPWSRSLRGRM